MSKSTHLVIDGQVVEPGSVLYYVSDTARGPEMRTCEVVKASSKQVTLKGYHAFLNYQDLGGYGRQWAADVFAARCAWTPDRAVALAVKVKTQQVRDLRARASEVEAEATAIAEMSHEVQP